MLPKGRNDISEKQLHDSRVDARTTALVAHALLGGEAGEVAELPRKVPRAPKDAHQQRSLFAHRVPEPRGRQVDAFSSTRVEVRPREFVPF